jgi:hypothetical protein
MGIVSKHGNSQEVMTSFLDCWQRRRTTMPIRSKDQANPSSHITNAAAAEENQRKRQNLALEEYTMRVLTNSCSCPSGLWIIKCGIITHY